MHTNPDGQCTAIIRYRPFSINKIPGLKNDISITISVNENVLDTFTKCIFITSILTFINIQVSISKILGNCLKQETDFTRQKPKNRNCTILNFFDFRDYPYKPLCTLCLEQFEKSYYSTKNRTI